ncbi:CYTH domain-containing protein [Halomonas sp. LS-001]
MVEQNHAENSPQEIELKLAIPEASIPQLKHHALLANQKAERHTLTNTYFDTPEGLLANARIALRLRRDDNQILQTVKTAGQGGGGLSTRGEWEWALPQFELDIAGLTKLPPFAELDHDLLTTLAPKLETNFTRTRWEIEQAGSLIELVLDEGEIVSGQYTAPIREVELELKSGQADTLWDVATLIAQTVPLRPSDSSKAVRGEWLAEQRWHLPEASSPGALLHRATVALDAFHDSQQASYLDNARDTLQALADHSNLDEKMHFLASQLLTGLSDHGQPDSAYGVSALTLARRFAEPSALS